MAKVFLLLGGNMGDRLLTLTLAKERLIKDVGKFVDKSSFFETAPWGFEHDQNFWNQVVVVDTQLSPQEVLAKTQIIEADLGRVRTKTQYSARLIDIDILFYADQIVNDENLTIPHPRIQERMFALAPLAEVAASMKHPVLKDTISLLMDKCTDKLAVEKIDPFGSVK